MKYKFVAIDLDDTLLDDDLQISEQTIVAIQEAVKKDVVVTLATGRMYQSAVKYAKKINLNVPIITYQGALVKNIIDEEVLYEKLIPYDLSVSIIQELRKAEKHFQIYINDELYIEKNNPYIVEYSKISQVDYYVVDDLLLKIKESNSLPIKILVIDNPDEISRMREEFSKKYSDQINITISKPHFLEFSHREATKGQAIKYLTDKMNISLEEVIAIGDSYNDLDMIEMAGLGVAMGNGHPDIKKKANYITKANNDHGVWEVLQKFIINK